MKWKPSISINNLFKRTKIIKKIRNYLDNKGFLEVDTPYLSHNVINANNILPFKTSWENNIKNTIVPMYLITSPESHMKRLIAYGCKNIYQICHSFRNKEYGKLHNPEFTMLELYKVDCNLFSFMNEINIFLIYILSCKSAEFISYRNIFYKYLELDPLSEKKSIILKKIKSISILQNYSISMYDTKDHMLQLLFTSVIQPKLGNKQPTFIYYFPASQAELSKISTLDNRISERFEVYYKGIELANGYYELTDYNEQKNRFLKNKRKNIKSLKYSIDNNLLDALKYSNFPKCSGIALGIDRLIMLALNEKKLSSVITFDIEKS